MKRRVWLPAFATSLLILMPGCQAVSNLAAGSTRDSDVDGMVMVFVPAGEFLMGSGDSDAEAESDEQPQHSVYLDAFWIDRTEVTQAMYAGCVAGGECTEPMRASDYARAGYADHPVTGVTWFQAGDYCAWAGRRLPTEAEWEKAARGTDARLYPWGNTEPDSKVLNFNRQLGDTTAVGAYPTGASSYGALDMAGNVWEWAADWYEEDYYANSPSENPQGPPSGNRRALRGGAWGVEARAVRVTNRFWAFPGRNDLDGFRCAWSP